MSKYARMGRTARAKKRDANEPAIIKALEAAGASVVQLDKPVDLLVGYGGRTILLEVKNIDGANRITNDQRSFIDSWNGDAVAIIYNADQALALLGRC